MKIKGFIWFEDIIQKLLWKHHVTQKEVAELFDNSPRFFFVEKAAEKTKMFIPPWDKPSAEDIWRYILFIKKIIKP